MRIYNEATASIHDPTAEQLSEMLDQLALDCRFVIAERSDQEPYDQHFMQVYLEDDRSYAVEYRAGDEAHHFGVHLAPDTDELPGIFASWLADDDAWRSAVAWLPLAEFDAEPLARMTIRLPDTAAWYVSALERLLDPALRPTAEITNIDGTTIEIQVRDVCWDQAQAIVLTVLDDTEELVDGEIEIVRD